MRRTLLGALLLLGIGVAFTPASNAGEPLENRIEAVTGIVRTVDTGLQERAANRSIQIQTDFSHCCLALDEAEIIAWNGGFSDPVGQFVISWSNSPDHAAILFDPGYQEIGCAVSASEGMTYGVCLFRHRTSEPIPTRQTPVPGTLPDAAMPH